jgi:hypothetical protein
MSWDEKQAGEMMNTASDRQLDEAQINEVLKSFRQSVHAWSDAALSLPRSEVRVAVHRGWRLAAAWALGCVLAAASLAGGFYERHERQMAAAMSAEHEAQQRQLAAQQSKRQTDEELLATVDSDIARTVPAAMEPLAQLMDEGESQ